jgi:hypothetical protein
MRGPMTEADLYASGRTYTSSMKRHAAPVNRELAQLVDRLFYINPQDAALRFRRS